MSHILIRKHIDDQISFAGRNWWYSFHILPSLFKKDSIKEYAERLSKTYSKQTKIWNDDLNSEWISRIFLAGKMVLSSSVMLQSLEYAENKNLRIVVTYLEYYSILMALRAMVFTSPLTEWRNGELIKLDHKRTINIAGDILSKLDKKLAAELRANILHLKAYRELISYRAPSSGDSFPKSKTSIDTRDICQMLVELAQLQSEVLESSVCKNAKGKFTFKRDFIKQVCHSEIEGNVFWDKEDAYRMHYLRRKYPLPTNICHMMSEGHVEDFFGSWCAKDETDNDVFDPDNNWRIIFDVP